LLESKASALRKSWADMFLPSTTCPSSQSLCTA